MKMCTQLSNLDNKGVVPRRVDCSLDKSVPIFKTSYEANLDTF